MAETDSSIIIKKVKKGAHGHHGGAWKIAYADFVTAMMAFFLLLWLITAASPEQKEGIADYFSPPNISETTSGSGGVLAGTAHDAHGAKTATEAPPEHANLQQAGYTSAQGKEAQTDVRSTEDRAFHSAAVSIKQAWDALPEITTMSDNLLIEETEDGLDIMIVNQDGRPMFAEGSKYPLEHTRAALAAMAPILERLPNQISISGHTAAGQLYGNPRYGTWELSSDRANTTRAILSEFGLSADRFHSVVGRSTEDPYFPNDPRLPANERVKVTVLHTAPPVPMGMKP